MLSICPHDKEGKSTEYWAMRNRCKNTSIVFVFKTQVIWDSTKGFWSSSVTMIERRAHLVSGNSHGYVSPGATIDKVLWLSSHWQAQSLIFLLRTPKLIFSLGRRNCCENKVRQEMISLLVIMGAKSMDSWNSITVCDVEKGYKNIAMLKNHSNAKLASKRQCICWHQIEMILLSLRLARPYMIADISMQKTDVIESMNLLLCSCVIVLHSATCN